MQRITTKRQIVQALLIAAALLLPFATIGGNPLLRMEIGTRTLFMFGAPVRIDQFYLVLLATLFVLSLFLLITVLLGRVWCGWLCPQTVFNDLAELIGMHIRKRLPPFTSTPVEHLMALLISGLISFNLSCWFIPPGQVLTRLINFSADPILFTCFIGITFFGYLNLIMVKRNFCLSYCPYGRFQAALLDSATLNLAFLEETKEYCLRCDACVRSCPMGVDIRNGFQIECIGCGRCIDACRGVMEGSRNSAGLIDYRFGEVRGTRMLFGGKAIFLSILSLLLGSTLFLGLLGMNQAAFAVQSVASVEPHLMAGGFSMQPWRATIGNRSESANIYSIRISSEVADEVTLVGPVDNILIPANEHREVIFAVRRKSSGENVVKASLMLVTGNRTVATERIRP